MPSEERDSRGGGDGEAAARARGVGHRFDGRAVLAGVDLALARGAITVLVGANGAGKTTLLRILAGIVEPSEGEVVVLGVARPARRRARARRALRRRTAYLCQEPALDPEMTGGEILDLAATLHGLPRRARRRRVAELAAAFGVESHLGRRVGGWSGGLKRRLHLAAGLVHEPELLLLDEPTAGLDPEGCRLLWADLAARAERGSAVAVVTHDLAAAERHAGAVAVLDAGALVAAGAPRELAAGQDGGAATLADVFRRHTGRDVLELVPRPRGAR
jgi:ABC-2 type transport system ATP-binding protein